jgi:2-polyprenyl-3-methyl-5-hydroxy-6-metoxy-1,4-benzoquinol methylase
MRGFADRFLADTVNTFAWNEADRLTTFDVIWCNSVVQYMIPNQFSAWLAMAADRLKPGGRIVVSDLIPPGHLFLGDAVSLAFFSLQKGYFFDAWKRTSKLSKQYDDVKHNQPLNQPSDNELSQYALDAGLQLQRLNSNLTHFHGRRSYVFTRSNA